MAPTRTATSAPHGWTRRLRTLLVVVPSALALAVLSAPNVASADEVIQGCTIVEDPYAAEYTICRNMDLSGINLSQRQMQYADFTGSDLSNANLSLSDWNFTKFDGADLTGANFSDTTTYRSAFNDVDLTGADLTRTFWAETSAQRIVLVNATLTDSILGYVDFTNADLTGANLTRANFGESTVTGANFTRTLLLPSDQQLPDASAGTIVEWTVPPGLSGAAVTECTPPSGSAFPTGTTTVRCVVAGTNGQGFGTFTVTIGRDVPSGGSSGSSGSSVGGLFGGILG